MDSNDMSNSVHIERIRSLILEGSEKAVPKLIAFLRAKQSRLQDRDIIPLHNLLLLGISFPRDQQMLRVCERALKQLSRDTTLRLAKSARTRRVLKGSGIEGASTRDSFTLEGLAWVSELKGTEPQLLSKRGDLGRGFDSVFSGLIGPAGEAAVHPQLLGQELLALVAGRTVSAQLAWLSRRTASESKSINLLDALNESLDLSIEWHYHGVASQTHGRLHSPERFYHRGQARSSETFREVLGWPLPREARLSAKQRADLRNRAMGVLVARNRETDPVTYSTPRGVQLFRLERGIDVALFSLRPERRLPIDSYVGFVAARNSIPVAYGGAWILGPRAEIGINIFEPFRGADSRFLYAQIARTYAQAFRLKRFIIPPYQFGEGNQEAIRSGAYWFYHGLGFRSMRADLRTLAEKEERKRSERTSYRSSSQVLRALADAPLAFDLGQGVRSALDVKNISLGLLSFMAKEYRGNLETARVDSESMLRRWAKQALSRTVPRWNVATLDFGVLVLAMPRHRSWNREVRKRVIEALHAKTSDATEKRFISLVSEIPELLEGLAHLERQGSRAAVVYG